MRLLLLRHAKSDRSGSDAEQDHERSLSERGKIAAPAIAAYMRDNAYEPELVLCSTAKRTKQTLKLVLPLLRAGRDVRFLKQLYLAEWPALLAHVQKAPAKASPLLLVGHNPGLHELAIELSLPPETDLERWCAKRLARKFPTAALAVLDFSIESWSELEAGLGRLSDYVRPKDLVHDKRASA